MSLLRDALGTGTDAKAEQDRETPEDLSFSGPVLDADELLGGAGADRERTLIPDNKAGAGSEPTLEIDSTSDATLPVDDTPINPSVQGAAFGDEPLQNPATAAEQAATAQVASARVNEADPEAQLQQSSAQQVPPTHPPEPVQAKSTGAVPRRFVNPDPLFFIIIAFACVALFGSVYALVTQNDDYVSREYAELRARQNNLEALIAEQQQQLAQSAAATTASVASEPDEASGDGIETSAAAEQTAQTQTIHNQTAQTQSVQEQVTASTQSGAANTTSTTEEVPVASTATDTSVTSVNVPVSTANTQNETPNENLVPDQQSVASDQPSASDQQIVLLQQELSALRKTIAGQDKKISQLLKARALQQSSKASVPSPSIHSSGTKLSTPDTIVESASSTPVYDKAGDVTIVEEQTAMVLADDRPQEIRLPPQGETNYVDGGFSALIGQAFHAYSTGNMALAGTLYRRAVQLEPYNRDANLGVAAVATDAGEFAEATQRYRHLLSLNPGDEVAFSGMLNLVAASGDRTIENEMIVHTTQYQQMPVLHAALGNYFSRQSRWSEASDSYATAAALAPDTADYLYNFAVSLDQLGNTVAAIENYERAMAVSATGHHSFDSITVSNRLQSLKQP